jgi:apolipoprotein N-acyltransferase
MVWLAAGAALFFLITRIAAPPAAWIALILLLHASRSMPLVQGTLTLWVAVYAALAFGLRGIVPAGGASYFAIVGFYATSIAVPFALDRAVPPSVAGGVTTLVLPIAFVATEFLRSRVSPAATWGSLAYSQYGYLPIMQIASVAGIWSLTFLIAWFASTVEWAWSGRFDSTSVHAPLLTCAAAVGVALLAGTIRLAAAPTGLPSLRVATLNRPVDLFQPGEMTRIAEGRLTPDERANARIKLARLHDWFLEGSRREARAGARLIAWPEQNLLVFAEDEPTFLERARRLAADERVVLVIGFGTIHCGANLPFENKSVVISPDGQVMASYLKTHPVPGWEAGIMRRGDGRVPAVASAIGRISTLICFDADFPELVRQAGEQAADLLIVPANDWKSIREIHAQMAAFRAIENGVSLVRAAASGISMAVDPWGRVLARTDFFSSGDRTLTAQVPVSGVRTIYARTGDLFAWLCVAAASMLLIAQTGRYVLWVLR